MLRSGRFVLLLSIALGVVLSGCRTYGGDDTEAKTYEALQAAVQSFEQDLDRAKADLGRLEEAAAESDTLQVLTEEFRALVEEHESLLEVQHRRIDRLSPNDNYRDLHWAFGASVTENRIQKQKYQRVIRNVGAAARGTSPAAVTEQSLAGRYTVRPLGFPDRDTTSTITMAWALRGL